MKTFVDPARGEGAGLGANLSLPLPRGTGDGVFLETLSRACALIDSFAADVIVVAPGLDAYVGDPFQGLAVTIDGFAPAPAGSGHSPACLWGWQCLR